MDLQTQEKISKIMIEQAEKLSIALNALRRIDRLKGYSTERDLDEASYIASQTLREISDYGKDPKDL